MAADTQSSPSPFSAVGNLAARAANAVYRTLRPKRHAEAHRRKFGQEAIPLSAIASIVTPRGALRFDTPNEATAMRARTLLKKEPETIAWINTMGKDDVFYDVGANVGVYSLYAALRGLRVIAFEPESQNYAVLNRNIHLNRFGDRITAFCLGLSDADAFTSIYLSKLASGASLHSVGQAVDMNGAPAEGRLSQGCFSTSLDRFIAQSALPAPTHIKIDVDGIEALIIAGAAETLRAPGLHSICIEINTNLAADSEAVAAIEALGFARRRQGHTGANGCRNEIFTRHPNGEGRLSGKERSSG